MSVGITNDLGTFSQSLVALVEAAAAGVVAIKAAPYRTASGVITASGLIVTAHHALRRDGTIPVQLADGTRLQAEIVGRDPSLDLAFLRAEGASQKALPAADPETLKPGSLAAGVGMTTDVGPSASLGILGAVGPSRRTWRGGTLDHFFRLDINLYPSQCGGAVVNTEGNLIGMATPGLLRHAAVAVPGVTLDRVATELLSEGRIRYGFLGVGLQPVTMPSDLRERAALKTGQGLMILSIEPDSPAHKAGLQLGDILVAINQQPVEDVEELQALLRGEVVGKPIPFTIIRSGERIEQQVVVGERPRRNR